MTKKLMTGSFVAPPTPFNQDESVDFEGFRAWIDFHHSHGTSALLIMGSTGEVSTLSSDERKAIIRYCVMHRKPHLPLWFGCTMNNTATTIDMVKYAGAEGADGAILTVPSYICVPEDDAVRYYLEVADASPIPIGIYNNPPRVKTDLQAEHILKLADHPNIVIDKEAMSRPGQITKILAAKKQLSLMCCDSPNLGLIMPVMSLGGHGTANMTGNVAPEEMNVISKPWKSFEDAEACRKMYLRLSPLLFFNYSKVNPVPIKSLCKALGLPSGEMRKPGRCMDGEELARGVAIVRELGLIEKYGYAVPGTRQSRVRVASSAAE